MSQNAGENAASPSLHDRVEAALASLGCDIDAPECHGMLCGVLCGPGAFDRDAWLAHVRGDEPGTRGAQSSPSLDELVAVTEQALAAPELSFDLLLPNDNATVSVRAQAFASWCRGYLSGLGLAGIADLNALGEDAAGFVRDVERFCSLSATEGEDDERALAELTEFTRVGVLLLREEAQVQDRPDAIH